VKVFNLGGAWFNLVYVLVLWHLAEFASEGSVKNPQLCKGTM